MTTPTLLRLILSVTTLLAAAPPLSAVAQPATPNTEPRSTLYASDDDIDASLPAGTPGAVSVVAQSDVLAQGDRVIVIARNGSDQSVSALTVHVVEWDMSRKIVASGISSVTAPVAIPPGRPAIVRVALDGNAAPEMVAGITVEITTPTPHPGRLNLAIRYANLRDGVLTDSVKAIDVDAAYDPELLIVCIGEDGTVTNYAVAPLEPRRIDPYRPIPRGHHRPSRTVSPLPEYLPLRPV